MDWGNPLRSIAATVDVDVLSVLGRTRTAVTGNQLARLSGRSYAQVHAVVDRLVAHGIVLVEQHGRTYSYQLNRDHVLAGGMLDILGAAQRVEDAIADRVSSWAVPAFTIALFGSAARRDADFRSDLDLLIIRRDRVSAEDAAWTEQTRDLAEYLERLTGNRVQLVELSETELEQARRSHQPLIESLRRESRTLIGANLRELLSGSVPHAKE